MPKVSVIIPSYNHARYLRQRLDSIFAQTYQNYEVIALDDASPDDSVEILREYEASGKLRLVVNEKNSGTTFAQWKKGLTMAKGEYTWIAESDDFASPFLLEKLVAAMEANPSVGLAYAQSMMVDENGANMYKYCWAPERFNPKRWDSDFVNKGVDEVARYLFALCLIPNASAVLTKTALLKPACQDADKYRLTGDWRTYVEVLMHSDIAFIAEPLNYFRTHANTVRSNAKQFATCAEMLQVRAHICARVRVAASERELAVKSEFRTVQTYIDTPGAVTDPEWIKGVMKSARAIHWSAMPRLWSMKIRRQAMRIPFLTRIVRFCKRVKRGIKRRVGLLTSAG